MSQDWTQSESREKLSKELTAAALDAWKQRKPNEYSVRFMQRLPAQHGEHYRFFTVTQRETGDLVVSSGRHH